MTTRTKQIKSSWPNLPLLSWNFCLHWFSQFLNPDKNRKRFRFFHWILRFVNKYLNFPGWFASVQTDWRRERWKLRDFPKFAGRQLGASSPTLATCPDACARFQTFLFKRTSQNTNHLKMLSKQKLFQINYYRGKIFYFVEIRPFWRILSNWREILAETRRRKPASISFA